MSNLKIFVIVAALMLLASSLGGCATKRAITMTSWWENYVYVGYWEGKCDKVMGFCQKGQPMVKRCNINDDNTVTCVQETELETLLQGESAAAEPSAAE